ncbi:hypothetical protein [Bradyrhizobium lablabi]|uniref:hypothetical protein n=1 Tax=Bradyrhizobium lablabi TaxID=722472 RepID=UPI001BA4D678|nr:hypothetical protein [Bradyrhizobium lablabi]MBR0696327.1 hypothetical protein [Bradyrhizobium lablabi]
MPECGSPGLNRPGFGAAMASARGIAPLVLRRLVNIRRRDRDLPSRSMAYNMRPDLGLAETGAEILQVGPSLDRAQALLALPFLG